MKYASLEKQYVWLASVDVAGDYCVHVTFTDGVAFETDLKRRFVGPYGKILGPPSEFARVRLDHESDALLWDNGFHVHGESLYENNAQRA